MNFVHLKAFTEYSITQGLTRIDDLVDQAHDNNMGALTITDLNGMFGSINFYKACLDKGIKPIIGLTASIEPEDGKVYQLTLLAKSEVGYRSLIELNTKGYIENRKKDTAPIKEEWLGSLQDVIVLSGAKHGLIGQKIIEGKMEEALDLATQMRDAFGEDFYIELQRDGSKEEEAYMSGAVEICSRLNIAPVATHPVLFMKPEDFVAHETRYCIGASEKLFSLKRPKPFNKAMYFMSQEEMQELFSDIPQALSNTVAIAHKCNIKLSLNQPKLPNFPTPNGEDINSYFAQLAMEGLEMRLQENFPDPTQREQNRPRYEERLQEEIGIIQKMGFPGYFLIVADFINWAKSQDIPVGPGRGSGAGSLVAYSMGITDLDPLPYNLLFERFLNPERVSMPDFDIDFCQSRRNEVYEYVRQKYGEQAVSQIGTFGTMAAKAVIRDVGRALDYHYDFVDTLAKMIYIPPASETTLRQYIFGDESKSIEPHDKLLERYNNEPDVKKLIDIALTLEGLTKQVGTHAAGVVIAPTTLTDFTPLYTLEAGAAPASQFEKNNVEEAGLVKFDFLGLRNLTIIKEAVDLVNERKKQQGDTNLMDLRKIPIDDEEVYKHVFAKGNTEGIFQFSGKGITGVLKKANPKNFADIIAINALYRPGPMEIIPEWLESKNMPEERRPYPHEKLRGILKETYGFMIYQEQVMQCAQIIAGYSLGGADLLRRAMGKKKPEEMRKQREVFISGAAKNGVNSDTASQLFDLIEKFSGYGFNKSHAAAYSYVAYQTAYLKHYYPEELLTATLNSHIGTLDTDKIAISVKDANDNSINVLAPDVNRSNYAFTVEGEKQIRYGLAAIKGVGEKAAHSIEQEREKNGPFVDFYDFLERAGKGNVNKRVLEALVKSGAFDSINDNRAELMASIEEGQNYVAKFRKQQMKELSVLGDAITDGKPVTKRKTKKPVEELVRPTLAQAEPWDEITQLRNEKAVFGYFFSSNPYETYYSVLLGGLKSATPLAKIREEYDEGANEVYVGAVIEEIKWWKSKKGAFVRISDGTSTAEVRMFADFLNENKDWLKPDSFASLRLKLQLDDNDDSLMSSVNQGFSFDQTYSLTASKIFVGCESDGYLEKFNEICEPYKMAAGPEATPIMLCAPEKEGGRRSRRIALLHVKPDFQMREKLVEVFGHEWVKDIFKEDIDKVVFPELPSRYSGKKKNYKGRQSFSV